MYCLPFLLYASEAVSLSASHMRALNSCCSISAAYKKLSLLVLGNAESIKVIRHFVGLQDIVKLVEDRRLKFVNSLIKSGSYVDLFSANRPL